MILKNKSHTFATLNNKTIIMKKLSLKLILIVISLSGLIITGCSNNNDPIKVVDESKTINLLKYEKIVYNNRELLSDWAYAKQEAQERVTRATFIKEAEYFKKLKNNLLPSAYQFASELNITKDDLESMTGVNIHSSEEYENTLVGLMLFITTMDCSRIDDKPQTRGGSFVECFSEATGIAAGVAIVGNLAKRTVSKAVVRAALKMVAKVGTRTLSGVGLALIAAEITYCMW